jgi:hypothetical protein
VLRCYKQDKSKSQSVGINHKSRMLVRDGGQLAS